MSTPKRKPSVVPVTFWAVGRTKTSALVALKLNDETPVVLRVSEARDIGQLLYADQARAGRVAPVQGSTSAIPSPAK